MASGSGGNELNRNKKSESREERLKKVQSLVDSIQRDQKGAGITKKMEMRSASKKIKLGRGQRREYKIKIGWENYRRDKYRLVTKAKGGETREIPFSIGEDLTVKMIKDKAIDFFFPDGKNIHGRVEEFEFMLVSTSGDELNNMDSTIHEYLKARGIFASQCHLYLRSKKIEQWNFSVNCKPVNKVDNQIHIKYSKLKRSLYSSDTSEVLCNTWTGCKNISGSPETEYDVFEDGYSVVGISVNNSVYLERDENNGINCLQPSSCETSILNGQDEIFGFETDDTEHLMIGAISLVHNSNCLYRWERNGELYRQGLNYCVIKVRDSGKYRVTVQNTDSSILGISDPVKIDVVLADNEKTCVPPLRNEKSTTVTGKSPEESTQVVTIGQSTIVPGESTQGMEVGQSTVVTGESAQGMDAGQSTVVSGETAPVLAVGESTVVTGESTQGMEDEQSTVVTGESAQGMDVGQSTVVSGETAPVLAVGQSTVVTGESTQGMEVGQSTVVTGESTQGMEVGQSTVVTGESTQGMEVGQSTVVREEIIQGMAVGQSTVVTGESTQGKEIGQSTVVSGETAPVLAVGQSTVVTGESTQGMEVGQSTVVTGESTQGMEVGQSTVVTGESTQGMEVGQSTVVTGESTQGMEVGQSTVVREEIIQGMAVGQSTVVTGESTQGKEIGQSTVVTGESTQGMAVGQSIVVREESTQGMEIGQFTVVTRESTKGMGGEQPSLQLVKPGPSIKGESSGSTSVKSTLDKLDIVVEGVVEIRPSQLRYIEEINKGAFGIVYKAVWNETTVAVKKIPVKRMKKSKHLLERELKVNSSIRHPSIVLFLGYHVGNNEVQLVTEYMNGPNLEQVLFEESELDFPLDKRISTGYQICSAVSYLHSRIPVILHRDIKPENVVLSKCLSVAKLCDMGLSKFKSFTTVITTMAGGTQPGTAAYKAPEVFLYNSSASLASDVWSLSATLVELLTDEVIWENSKNTDSSLEEYIFTSMKHEEQPDGLKCLENKDIPIQIKEVVSTGLEYRVSARPAAVKICQQFREMLRD